MRSAMSAVGTKRTWATALHMSAFGGTADRAQLLRIRLNKIRHFLQSIFPASAACKGWLRPKPRGVDKATCRQRCHVGNIAFTKVNRATSITQSS